MSPFVQSTFSDTDLGLSFTKDKTGAIEEALEHVFALVGVFRPTSSPDGPCRGSCGSLWLDIAFCG